MCFPEKHKEKLESVTSYEYARTVMHLIKKNSPDFPYTRDSLTTLLFPAAHSFCPSYHFAPDKNAQMPRICIELSFSRVPTPELLPRIFLPEPQTR